MSDAQSAARTSAVMGFGSTSTVVTLAIRRQCEDRKEGISAGRNQFLMVDIEEFDTWELRQWLGAFARGLGPRDLLPEDWLSAVQRLTFLLSEARDELTAQEWPLASDAMIRALRFAEEAGAIDRQEAVIRQMYLTALIVETVPPDDDIELLSPRSVLEFSRKDLAILPDEARRRAVDWHEKDIDDIRELRRIKLLVKPALMLKKYIVDTSFRAQLDRWEEVEPTLP